MAATVNMSLKEYDELKEELNFYKNIVHHLCSIDIEPWNIQKYKEGTADYLSGGTGIELSYEEEKFLDKLVSDNFSKFLKDNDINDLQEETYPYKPRVSIYLERVTSED